MVRNKYSVCCSKPFVLGVILGVIIVSLWSRLTEYEDSLSYIRNYYNKVHKSKQNQLRRRSPGEKSVYQKIYDATECNNVALPTWYAQRGKYWVLHNFITAEVQFACYETVTFTTHGSYDFLDNLIILADLWRGPISVAVHAPGADFRTSLDTIAYLRNCKSHFIKKYVTFHLFFEEKNTPKLYQFRTRSIGKVYRDYYNCKSGAPRKKRSFKTLYNLQYPINAARNIAREAAQTHYVLSSDIELYPSRYLPKRFLGMLAENPQFFRNATPKAFVLPVFQVDGESIPENKTNLREMINKKEFDFHNTLCPMCNIGVDDSNWITGAETEKLYVSSYGKRLGKYRSWEPFYIGTNSDPYFDERLMLEDQGNRITQAHIMCIMDYEYLILNNAFLVHKPGTRTKKEELELETQVTGTNNNLIDNTILPEIQVLFGDREGCVVNEYE